VNVSQVYGQTGGYTSRAQILHRAFKVNYLLVIYSNYDSQLTMILNKNRQITEANSELIIETLRSISELMIWGDQNNPTFWEYEDIFRLNSFTTLVFSWKRIFYFIFGMF
jgi:hypothetical protein